MSTATSSIHNIKSRLPTSNSINNIMTTNGNENKSNRIYIKKPLSATNMISNYSSTNGFNNHLKKRTVLSNNSHIKKSNHHYHQQQQNGHNSNKQVSNNRPHSPSPPVVFHAIAPAPLSEEITDLKQEINDEQKVSL